MSIKKIADNLVEFGSYPQSLVKDEEIIDALNNMAGELPTTSDKKKWKSYKYYRCGEDENGVQWPHLPFNRDFMWYIDKKYKGVKYRGVYFKQYRACALYSVVDREEDTNQALNGYHKETIYWFRWEPLRWRIRYASKSEWCIVSDIIIDSQLYNANGKYAVFNKCDLGKWLNKTFYNYAFTKKEKEIIAETTIETEKFEGGFDLAKVRVFIPSKEDALDYVSMYKDESDPADPLVKCYATDYSKCQGIASTSDVDQYSWWTRSIQMREYDDAFMYVYNGLFPDDGECIDFSDVGVVPELVIRIS